MNSISRFLPSISQGSFLANQWLRVQNSPLAVRITLVVAGIFAGAALAYACFKGIRALRNRPTAPQNAPPTIPTPPQNALSTIKFMQNGKAVTLTEKQLRAALALSGAKWVQVACPGPSWDDVAPETLADPTKFDLNVISEECETDPDFPYRKVSADGTQSKAIGDLYFHDQSFEWQPITRLQELFRHGSKSIKTGEI